MKVLMISGDKRVLDLTSTAGRRLTIQRKAVERLDVFVWPSVHSFATVVRASLRTQYDVVTAQDPFWRGLLGFFVSKLSRARLNLQVHADLSGQSPFRQTLANFLLCRANTIRAVSLRARQSLPSSCAARVSVLPIYVDIEPFRSLERKTHTRFTKVMLWMGRFEKEKDPKSAIEILEALRARDISVGLILLGAGSMGDILREEVMRRGLTDWVEFPGWQDPKTYLACADVVISTSLHESWGASIIESLAAGVPVVAPDVGIAREAGATVVPREEAVEAVAHILQTGVRGHLEIGLLSENGWASAWRDSL